MPFTGGSFIGVLLILGDGGTGGSKMTILALKVLLKTSAWLDAPGNSLMLAWVGWYDLEGTGRRQFELMVEGFTSPRCFCGIDGELLLVWGLLLGPNMDCRTVEWTSELTLAGDKPGSVVPTAQQYRLKSRDRTMGWDLLLVWDCRTVASASWPLKRRVERSGTLFLRIWPLVGLLLLWGISSP